MILIVSLAVFMYGTFYYAYMPLEVISVSVSTCLYLFPSSVLFVQEIVTQFI